MTTVKIYRRVISNSEHRILDAWQRQSDIAVRPLLWLTGLLLAVAGCQAHPVSATQPTKDLSATQMSAEKLFGLSPTSLGATSQPAGAEKVSPESMMAYMEGRLAWVNQKAADAIEHLQKALASDPTNVAAHRLLTQIYFEQRQYPQAKDQAIKLLELAPNDVLAHRVLGESLIRSDDFMAGGRHLYQAILLADAAGEGTSETAMLARFVLGQVLASRGYLNAAVDVYVQLLKNLDQFDETSLPRDPQLQELYRVYRPGLYLLVGEFLTKLEQFERAEAFYIKAQEFPATKTRGQTGLIACYRQTGKTEQAREVLDLLAAGGPVDENLVDLYRSLYPDKVWITKLLAVYKPSRENYQVGLRVAEQLVDLEEWSSAAELLGGLIAVDPSDPTALSLLVKAHQKLNTLDRCAELLINSLSNASYVPTVASELGARWDQATASALLSAIDKAGVGSDKAYAKAYLHGVVCQELSEFDQAEEYYHQSVTFNPQFVPAYLAWGNLLLLERRWSEVVKIADQALATNPSIGGLLYLKGRALSELDKLPEAIKTLEDATKQTPQSDQIYLALAEAYLRNNLSASAVKILQEAYKNELAGRDTVSELVQILIHANRLELAGQVLDRYNRRFGTDAQYQLLHAKLAYETDKDVAAYRLHLNGLVGKTARPGQAQIEQALLEYQLGNFRQAVAIGDGLLVRLQQTSPLLWPRDYLRLGELMALSYHRLFEFDQAEQAIKLLLHDWPNRSNFKEMLATLYLDAQKFDEAEKLLTELIDRAGDPIERLEMQKRLISSYLARDDLSGAISLIEGYMQKVTGPDQLEFQKLLLACYVRNGLYEKAVDRLNQWLVGAERDQKREWQPLLVELLLKQEKPDAASAKVGGWLAEADDKDREYVEGLRLPILLEQQKYDEAIELAKSRWKAADNLQEYPRMLVLINGYKQAKRYDEAETFIREQMKSYRQDSPRLAAMHYELIRTWELAGNYDQAERYLKTQLDEAPESGKSAWQQWLVVLYFASGQDAKAIELLEQVLSSDPELSWANNALGYCFADRGENLDRAEAMIRKALADDPTSPAYLDSLAWALYRKHAPARAEPVAMMALRRMDRPDPVILDHLGDINAAMNKMDRARKYWQWSLDQAADMASIDLEPNLRERVTKKLKQTTTQPTSSSAAP